ncbi:MAG: trypsin-like peptidase domain-containing protein, partial [Thermodesulfobacteriota bacterium]|nr:trypsin-like peptidase domain-containing protein [Thermodesulfobacteriota bacterium]
LIYDSGGKIKQLFPVPEKKQINRIEKNKEYIIPSKDLWFRLDRNVGTETILFLISDQSQNIEKIINSMKGVSRDKAIEIARKKFPSVKAISFLHIDREIHNLSYLKSKKKDILDFEVAKSSHSYNLFSSSKESILNLLNASHETGATYEDLNYTFRKIERKLILDSERGVVESNVYKKAAHGVVLVLSSKTASGTGVIIDKKGHIITNWHVVKDVDSAVVMLKPPASVELRKNLAYKAEVVKVDEIADLALLTITVPPLNLKTIKLGNITKVEVGQDVHTIGHPEGEVWTYTNGIISQIRPNYEWVYEDGIQHKSKVIQTQTPINPGSSGSPLLNNDAELIGINAFVRMGEGLNYAVSVDVIKEFMQRKISRKAKKPPLWGKLEPKFYTEHDLNKDGKIDLVILDLDGDKKPEVWIFDENQDNKPDCWGFDDNKNRIPDRCLRDLDGDGFQETHVFDVNEDGTTDFVGIDEDGDFKVDRFIEG